MLLSPPTSSAALWRHCAGAAAALGACAGSGSRLLTSGAHAYDFRFGGREGAEENGRRLRAAPRREQLRQAGSSPGGGSPALLPVEKSCRLRWGEEAAWARGSGLQRSVRDRRPTKAPPPFPGTRASVPVVGVRDGAVTSTQRRYPHPLCAVCLPRAVQWEARAVQCETPIFVLF